MTAPFHVGIVVPDIDRAMAELGTVLQTSWTDVLERPVGEWTLRVAFARSGPPYIELVEGSPGSPWDASDGPRMHHLGWWTEDRDAERTRLGAAGLEPEVDGHAIGTRFDYYAAPHSGLRLELIDAAGRDAFFELWGLPRG